MLAAVPPLPVVSVGLLEAFGLVLAEPVIAPYDVPPFANSAMDGYAVHAADVQDPPVELEVIEDLPAGYVASAIVRPGTAIKIMTGAPIPGGADAVVRVEDTEQLENRVSIASTVDAGTNVRAAGGDVVAGTRVFDAGERLGAAHLGVLASLGVSTPSVRRRPRVAILSTGDEVMDPSVAELQPGQIRTPTGCCSTVCSWNSAPRSSISASLAATTPIFCGQRSMRPLPGRTSSSRRVASPMGEYDLVKTVLREIGHINFWQVAMQPGKPFAFGLLNGTPFFGLPGNPVSVMVAFEQFARPALLHMMGAVHLYRPRVRAQMLPYGPHQPGKGRVSEGQGPGRCDRQWVAELSGGQLSNMLSALAYGNAFAVSPAGTGTVEAGDEIDVEMFTWPETRTKSEALDG